MKRLLTALLLVAAVLPLSPAAPAVAASGACTSSSGVTVVVSFGSVGGGTVVRCAQTSGSGLDALRAAGFSTEGTQKDGGAFVCRLDGKPTTSTESCRTTPPLTKSWRYFYADNGGSWKFSQSGAGSRTVKQGGFEGWSFGGDSKPGVAPRRAGSGSSGGAAGESPDAVVPEGPSSSEDNSLPAPKPRTGRTAGATPVPTPSATPTAEPTNGVDLAAAESKDGGSSIAPWIAGVVILALIAGVIVAQRRRSSRDYS